ncbi:putative molybdenum carrier protein [Thiomicrorhabdus indica]|uniref:putative molybdenum carrier protein n=1 Tax=Thiomicrorhabdus indica TaxID=2267253 RepID=UPI002AA742D5|nr:putative molybdenum carrier protein [Thiomicrorhabdus indica]
MIQKVVSGGQTGVDRAALDWALNHSINIGGFCPKGRLAENGIIPEIYPLIELDSPEYTVRTRANVENSDGTLIFFKSKLNGGTKNTLAYCEAIKKPYLAVELSTSENEFKMQFNTWLSQENIQVLNIAGPRASKCQNCYGSVVQLLNATLK